MKRRVLRHSSPHMGELPTTAVDPLRVSEPVTFLIPPPCALVPPEIRKSFKLTLGEFFPLISRTPDFPSPSSAGLDAEEVRLPTIVRFFSMTNAPRHFPDTCSFAPLLASSMKCCRSDPSFPECTFVTEQPGRPAPAELGVANVREATDSRTKRATDVPPTAMPPRPDLGMDHIWYLGSSPIGQPIRLPHSRWTRQ